MGDSGGGAPLLVIFCRIVNKIFCRFLKKLNEGCYDLGARIQHHRVKASTAFSSQLVELVQNPIPIPILAFTSLPHSFFPGMEENKAGYAANT